MRSEAPTRPVCSMFHVRCVQITYTTHVTSFRRFERGERVKGERARPTAHSASGSDCTKQFEISSVRVNLWSELKLVAVNDLFDARMQRLKGVKVVNIFQHQ